VAGSLQNCVGIVGKGSSEVVNFSAFPAGVGRHSFRVCRNLEVPFAEASMAASLDSCVPVTAPSNFNGKQRGGFPSARHGQPGANLASLCVA